MNQMACKMVHPEHDIVIHPTPMHPNDNSRYFWQALSVTLLAFLFSGCHPSADTSSGPLPQRGYLWQRAWTSAVDEATTQADQHLDGVIVLGAEIGWNEGNPRPIRSNISWSKLHAMKTPVSIALRIASYPGPFASNDATARAITTEATSLLSAAHAHGVNIQEFEVDFDCAQSKLKGYELWVQTLAKAVHPTRFVITTLPAWLHESEFPTLVGQADGYVLQVHSVPTLAESRHTSLCDPVLARKWVGQASKLGIPFSVALPTYSCMAGYDPAGKLINVAMDSVQPSWPPGTRVLEFGPDADDVADLVREWQTRPPQGLSEIIWYRLPVATDLRNWRWPTLLSVMSGRHPEHHLEVTQAGQAPVDLTIVNSGDADEQLNCAVVVRWNGSRPVACDALPGWSVSSSDGKAVFTTTDIHLRLSPGATSSFGWIRLGQIAALHSQIVTHEQK
jgi:hypothetical protein